MCFLKCLVIFTLFLVFKNVSSNNESNWRLTRDLVPFHYNLRLLPLLRNDFSDEIRGNVQIDMECNADTETIVLNSHNIDIKRESVRVHSRIYREQLAIRSMSFNNESQLVTFHLKHQLKKGGIYSIDLQFVSHLNDNDPKGIYKWNYIDEVYSNKTMVLSELQPNYARRVFPSFDEPSFKADFTLVIGRLNNMTSYSNMPKFKSQPIADFPEYTWDFFHRSYAMPTYAVAVAIVDNSFFAVAQAGNSSKHEIGMWAQPSVINQTRYSLELAKNALKFYENFFELEFPLKKLTIIAIPNSNRALENWGIVFLGEQFFNFEKKNLNLPLANKELNKIILAHEIAHQWLGGLVTINWWSDLWLNEGLATYFSYLALEAINVKTDLKIDHLFILNEMQTMMFSDAFETSHSMNLPVTHPNEIVWKFDQVSYRKGACIVRMLANVMGETTFKLGMNKYLQKLKFQNSDPKEFWSSFEFLDPKLPTNVTSIFEVWANTVGYPCISVKRNYSRNSATITQERFMLQKNNYNDTWPVPVTFTTNFSDGNYRKEWLESSEAQFNDLPQPSQWNWDLIISQLLDDHKAIDVVNRAALLDDAFNLARASVLDYSIALRLTMYLSKEREYLPWKTALNSLSYLDTMLKMTPVYEMFQKHMLNIILPMYNFLGFDQHRNTMLIDDLRIEISNWACKFKHGDCFANAIKLFRGWMQSTDIVSDNHRRLVTCTALRYFGNNDVWNFIWDEFHQSNDTMERLDLIAAMGCITNVPALTSLLQRALNFTSQLEINHFSGLIGNLAVEGQGILAFQFVRRNWIVLKSRYEEVDGELNAAVESVTSSFNTISHLTLLQEMQSEFENDDQVNTLLDYLQENIKRNVLWMDHNYKTMETILKKLI